MQDRRIDELDDNIDDGVYAIPRNSKEPRVKVRALWDYCKSRGIDIEEISEEEMKQFLVYPK